MAENMEDSGFDSDQKNMNSGDQESPMRVSVDFYFVYQMIMMKHRCSSVCF